MAEVLSVSATVNNQTVQLTYNEDTGYYSGTFISPTIPAVETEKGYYPISITISADGEEDKTVDDTDTIWGKILRLYPLVSKLYGITDRTQEDVDYVNSLITAIQNRTVTEEQYEAYQSDLKGAINKSDLERIKKNVGYTNELLGLVNTFPDIPEIPTESFYTSLLTCISNIRKGTFSNIPEVPSKSLNTYGKWNDIEKILILIFETYYGIVYYNCNGNYYAGGDIGLLE